MNDPTLTDQVSAQFRTSLYVGGSALALGALAFMLATDAIPQSLAYHAFADTRTCLGIPNALDVLSNMAFLAVGLLGVMTMTNRWDDDAPIVRWVWLVFFIGLIGVAIGSSYYHWSPDNGRLLWDRLPMTIGFMGLFTAVVAERVNLQVARWSFPILLVLGVASVMYWWWSERSGTGDLRPYILVQGLPLVAIPLILWATPRRFDRDGQYLVAIGWYVIAKALELGDAWVFNQTEIISGHSLKHLAAGYACYLLYRMYARRLPVGA